MIKDNER